MVVYQSTKTEFSIKHVYFDIGGVLLLDFSGTTKWTQLRRDLGFAADQDELFDRIREVSERLELEIALEK